MPDSITDKSSFFLRKYWWLVLVISSVFFILTAQPFSLHFLNDDFISIPFYSRHEFAFGGSTRIFAALTIYADYCIYGTNTGGYIITNILIHVLCCIVGLLWCRALAKSLNIEIPTLPLLIGSLLFMWFGMHSETVLWTICRTASLGLLSFFATWFCFLKIQKNVAWAIPAFFFLSLGLLSYEILLLIPIQIIIWYLLKKKKRENNLTLIVSLTLSAIAILGFLIFKYYLNNTITKGYGAVSFTELNIFGLVKNYFSLVVRTFVPPLANKLAVVIIGGIIAFILAILSLKIISAKQSDQLWKFLLCNWLLSYVLFAALGIDLSGNESDRYIYIPSFFFCMWLVYSIYLTILPIKVKYVIVGSIFLCHVIFFISSVRHFQNAGMLAKRTLLTISEVSGKGQVSINNLPSKAYGIPILRMGAKDGLHWLYKNVDTSKILIASELEIKVGTMESRSIFYSKTYDSVDRSSIITFFPR